MVLNGGFWFVWLFVWGREYGLCLGVGEDVCWCLVDWCSGGLIVLKFECVIVGWGVCMWLVFSLVVCKGGLLDGLIVGLVWGMKSMMIGEGGGVFYLWFWLFVWVCVEGGLSFWWISV